MMYAGKIVEEAAVGDLFGHPQHPYTIGLFESLPKITESRERLQTIPGQVPVATRFPKGCRFHPRCPYCMAVCRDHEPRLEPIRPNHTTACWLHDERVMREQGHAAGLPREETRT